jgi:hypothetical protein
LFLSLWVVVLFSRYNSSMPSNNAQANFKGEKMKRSKYLAALVGLLTVDEIKKSAAQPSPYMTKTHILLHHVALRRLGC